MTATDPKRISHVLAFSYGLAAGDHENETGELAECPYTMPEMIEDFWRGVRTRTDSANVPSQRPSGLTDSASKEANPEGSLH